jgi:hypothetical protein
VGAIAAPTGRVPSPSSTASSVPHDGPPEQDRVGDADGRGATKGYHCSRRKDNCATRTEGPLEDFTGIGRATGKFLELVQSSIGTLYRPRAIRKEGEAVADAEAYKVIALAKANNEARQITLDGQQALAERAVERLRHQELNKQKNLEAIIDQTIPKIEEKEEAVEVTVDKDWLSYFFESCATVSEEKVQALWCDVLASKIGGENLPRKAIDCLRWMDSHAAEQFAEFAQILYLFGGSFVWITQRTRDPILSLHFGYDVDALVDIGLIKENFNREFRFMFGSMYVTCKELSDRSLEHRGFFEFTQTGKKLASVVVPAIRKHRAASNELKSIDELKSIEERMANEGYSEKQFQIDNEVVIPEDRIKVLCGGISMFVIQNKAEVLIEKSLVRVQGREYCDDTQKVMSISTSNGELLVKQFKKGRHWKTLSEFEKTTLARLASFLKE